MKPWCLLFAAMLAAVPLHADNIYEIDAQGRKQVIQRDAIVIQNDSSYLAYKHFDLKERRVEKVSLAKGSLPFVVETSSPEVRAGIVGNWKRFGYRVTVTDKAGKTTQVFDAYLDFFPPGGRGSFLESVPATTSLALLLANGGADEIKFDEIARIEFSGGDVLTVVRRDGRTEQGKFLMPTQQPAEARLLGITDRYNPSSEEVYNFSVPLARLKEIHFGR
jgi:hypothetical protein